MKIHLFVYVVFATILLSCSQKKSDMGNYESKEESQTSPARAAAPLAAPSGSVSADLSGKLSESPEAELAKKDAPPATPETYISSSAAVERNDQDKRFIRKADIKFRSKDVIRTTYQIEDVVAANGGYVESSSLRTEGEYTRSEYFTKDSILEVTYYNLYADLIVRVPNINLDTTLKEIARFVDYLDHRNITATDVSIHLLQNKLTELRQNRYQERVAKNVDNKNIGSNQILAAEQAQLHAQERVDQAKLDNMILEDQIAYSTIHLTIYQQGLYKVNKSEAKPDLDQIAYSESFWDQLIRSFQSGWNILLNIILIIANSWSVLLVIVLLVLGFRMAQKILSRKKS